MKLTVIRYGPSNLEANLLSDGRMPKISTLASIDPVTNRQSFQCNFRILIQSVGNSEGHFLNFEIVILCGRVKQE